MRSGTELSQFLRDFLPTFVFSYSSYFLVSSRMFGLSYIINDM